MATIPGVTRQFNRIAKKYKFNVVNKAEGKVRDLTSENTPFGDKDTNVVVYNISCKCAKYTYVVETDRHGKENTRIK